MIKTNMNHLKIICNIINLLCKMISEDQFVGKFDTENYTIFKEYIDTEVPQIRLYHTKYTPQNPKYSIIIVHGFG